MAPAEKSAPVETLLDTMQMHGVDGAVLVPFGNEDKYVAECVRAHPGRFVGICVQQKEAWTSSDRTSAVLARRVEGGGFRGVRMAWLGDPGRPVEDSPVYPSLRWMAERDVVLWFYGPAEQLAVLVQAVARLPGLKVALNHLGVCPRRIEVDGRGRPRVALELPPPTLGTVLSLAENPRVHVMLSGLYAFSKAGYPYCDLHDLVTVLAQAFGADRLFWASDFPWVAEEPGYGKIHALARLHLAGATADELHAVYGGTVSRLFPGAFGARK